MSNKIIDAFVDKDWFGTPIGVNYKGSDAFKTLLGAFITLATVIFMLFNTTTTSIAWYKD